MAKRGGRKRRGLQRPKPTPGKNMVARESVSKPPKTQYPAFSLRYLDANYCLSNCDKNEKAAFADKIHRLSQLSWHVIDSKDKHGLGYEHIPRTSLKRRVPGHVTPEVPIIAFRFCGKKPMVGYRDNGIFYVIWFDRKYSLYRHGS